MPLHDHPYSDVSIIYSVVQTGERTTDRVTNSAPNMQSACQTFKGSVTGNTDLDNYILSSRVAPDTTDANVHALCTKPAVLKMEEGGKSSRGFRKKPSNCQRNNRNLQTSGKWEVLTSTEFNESQLTAPRFPSS